MTYQSKISKKFLALTLSAVIVGGAVVPSITSAAGFKDVEDGKWYAEAINVLSSKSIINGIDGNFFKPDDNMTKAEAVKMIAVAKGLKMEDVKAPGFSDVKEGQWFYKYVAAAKEAGIVKGDGTGKFDPNKRIDRAEMASLLVSAYKLDAKDVKINFTDVKASDWFYDEVQALVASGLTKGTSEKTFSPKKSLNRAEGAQFIYRAVNNEAADKTAQFIYDVNRIQGEGNLADKFAELKYDAFDKLTEVQQTEVAKLFLLKKGDTEFKTVDEITTAIDTAIKSYNDLLGAVNEAADAAAMKTSLEAIGGLFDIEVTEDMANVVLDAKGEGFASVTEIIDVLQAAADEAQFIFDVNRIEGEGNLAEKFAELKYEAFDKLTGEQQTEVAKLFLLTKGDTKFNTVDEITTAIDTAIKAYNDLLADVNEAADAAAIKAPLQAIGTLFDIVVTDEMATTVFNAKPENGFTSVKEMITLLQPAADAAAE